MIVRVWTLFYERMSLFENLQQLWPMPSRPRRITMIGAGGIVRDAHLPAYKKWNLPVAGIFDVDTSRAQALADKFLITRVHETFVQAMNGGTADVLDIAVPPQVLREVLEQVPPGSVALIQKPLGVNLAEARQMSALLKQRDVTAAVNFQLQFTPAMLAVSDAIARGLFGEITEVEVHLACATPWDDWPFMRTLEAVEIPLHSIHYLDWIRASFGQPEKVYAKSLPHPAFPELADARSSIILDYGDSIRCCLSLNHTHRWGTKNEQATIRVEGTKGAALVGVGYQLNFPDGAPETLQMIVKGGEWQDIELKGARIPDSFAGVMANLQRFASGEDDRLLTSIPDSVASMALVDACLKSNATGQAVKVEQQAHQ